MREVVSRAAKVVLLMSVAAAVVGSATSGVGTVLLESYVTAVGAVLLLALVRATRVQAPAGGPSSFESALAAMGRRAPDSRELPLVNELRLSRLDAFHLHNRLRPLLSEIAAHRLWLHYGVDLMVEPGRARELVGPAAWELVRPERPPPADRLEPGLPLSKLARVVQDLERL